MNFERFDEIAVAKQWSAETKYEILRSYLDATGVQHGFDLFLANLLAELGAGEAAPQPVADEADQFFGSSLRRAAFLQAAAAVTATETAAGTSVVGVSSDWKQFIDNSLGSTALYAGVEADAVITGVQATLANGDRFCLALCNSPHGPWLDAWLEFGFASSGLYPNGPQPSLPPRRDLESPFEFAYPDGKSYMVKLEVSP